MVESGVFFVGGGGFVVGADGFVCGFVVGCGGGSGDYGAERSFEFCQSFCILVVFYKSLVEVVLAVGIFVVVRKSQHFPWRRHPHTHI